MYQSHKFCLPVILYAFFLIPMLNGQIHQVEIQLSEFYTDKNPNIFDDLHGRTLKDYPGFERHQAALHLNYFYQKDNKWKLGAGFDFRHLHQTNKYPSGILTPHRKRLNQNVYNIYFQIGRIFGTSWFTFRPSLMTGYAIVHKELYIGIPGGLDNLHYKTIYPNMHALYLGMSANFLAQISPHLYLSVTYVPLEGMIGNLLNHPHSEVAEKKVWSKPLEINNLRFGIGYTFSTQD